MNHIDPRKTCTYVLASLDSQLVITLLENFQNEQAGRTLDVPLMALGRKRVFYYKLKLTTTTTQYPV